MRVSVTEDINGMKYVRVNCGCSDEEIAKSFIEDVEAVKDQLPCGNQMDFPDTFEEFAKDYGFKDKDEVYTNGAELIPVFRVEQWLEHIQKPRKGEWLRMSDLSEQDDYRYKCSCCGNVINHKSKMDLYTFNSWCGRCGSDNGRHINYEVEE